MDRKNQNILVGLIAVVIVIAVFSSFGLSLFNSPTPTITLPTPVPGNTEEVSEVGQGTGIRVEIEPETVQSTISALSRIESYSRTVTIQMGETENVAQVWVDHGWTRSDLLLASRMTVSTIVGDGTVWRWYSEEPTVVSWQADDASVDLDSQRIPTYEDVLSLPMERITAARYEEHDGYLCVYVEVTVELPQQKERYWVSVDSGLLAAAETEVEGEIVWSMTTTTPEIPVLSDVSFTLPDGTVLHKVGEMVAGS